MLDGARNSLLGYLYQLLGTAAVSAREVFSGTDSWAQFVARVGQGELLIEEFGQDATLHPTYTPDKGVAAIQFKHSGKGDVIERDELIDIVVAFDQARRDAACEGVTIEHYAIVTNRQLDPNAQEVVDHRGAEPHHAFTLNKTWGGKPVATTNKRLNPYQGDNRHAALEWHTIVQALVVHQLPTHDAGLHMLRQFAARYGVLEREWPDRLNALIGALVHETAQGQTIKVTQDWLKGHLIGDPNAANLRFGCPVTPHILSICRNRVDQRIGPQHRVPNEYYLERNNVQQELQSQLEQYPVVFVTGGGGRGKSLMVANYLRSVSNEQLVWSEGATTASERGLAETLTAARLPGRRSGGTDVCFADIRARLDVANRPRQALWTIDLDGIDEAPGRISELRDLINRCWARGNRDDSPATLVVTCRTDDTAKRPSREDLIADWFDGAEADFVAGVGFVELGNFVLHELVDAARLLNGEPEQRIIRAGSVGQPGSTQHVQAVAEDILQSLKHPIVWGSYAALTEQERSGVLNRDRVQLDHLGRQMHVRFLRRCQSRKNWRDPHMLARALPAVARATTEPPPYYLSTWDQACESCLDRFEARNLYWESLSYGIIERDAGSTWRWGHTFFVEYLVALKGGDADE